MTKKLIHDRRDRVGQLVCDECEYRLPEPLPFTSELIGYRCPQCSANMLTERDYRDTLRIFRVVDWINKWFGFLGTTKEQLEAEANPYRVGIRTHNGKAIIEKKSETSK